MPKSSNAKIMIPMQVDRNLKLLGEHIKIARKRRRQTLAEFSERIQVSIPTLRKIESGDPSCSMAAYANALWVLDRIDCLGMIANPEVDSAALMIELKRIK